jgi:hypothetical protein
MPFTIQYSKANPNAILPLPTYDNPIRTISNPNNNIGLHPTFGWATFHLGSHTADFSDLSSGNVPLFGGGFDLRPGKFRLAYSDGFTTWAIRPDTTLNLNGGFRRRMQALKIGYGKEGKSGIYLNAIRIRDDLKSVNEPIVSIKPKEGVMISSDFTVAFSKYLIFSGEAGASGFTNDHLADELPDNQLPSLPFGLFTPRNSSRVDWAGKAALKLNFKTWGLALQSRYLGPGFEPLGYNFAETDLFEYTVAPRLQLFNNKLIFNGSIGWRQDNLAKTKLSTSKRVIGNANINIMATRNLSISANYANYGMRNDFNNDTLRIEFISNNYAITPSYRFKTGQANHTISLTYNASIFEDKNLLTGALGSNDAKTVSASYSVNLHKLMLSGQAFSTQNKRLDYMQDITTGSFTAGYALLKRKLNVSATVLYSKINYSGQTADTRLLFRPQLRWKLPKQIQFQASGSIQAFQYGSVRNAAAYKETFFQTTFIKTF